MFFRNWFNFNDGSVFEPVFKFIIKEGKRGRWRWNLVRISDNKSFGISPVYGSSSDAEITNEILEVLVGLGVKDIDKVIIEYHKED